MKRYAVPAMALFLLLLMICRPVSASEVSTIPDTEVESLTFDDLSEYQEYIKTVGLPDHYPHYSALAILGDFRKAVIGSNCRYDLVDINGFSFTVTIDDNADMLASSVLMQIDSLPNSALNMSQLYSFGQRASFCYVRNGVYYSYLSNNVLYSIEWLSDGVCYRISNFSGAYPTAGAESIMRRIMSTSDAEATAAFEEFTNYARINIDPEPSLHRFIVPVITFLILAVLVALAIYIHKKRKDRLLGETEYF